MSILDRLYQYVERRRNFRQGMKRASEIVNGGSFAKGGRNPAPPIGWERPPAPAPPHKINSKT